MHFDQVKTWDDKLAKEVTTFSVMHFNQVKISPDKLAKEAKEVTAFSVMHFDQVKTWDDKLAKEVTTLHCDVAEELHMIYSILLLAVH